jgi:hypothetical protein
LLRRVALAALGRHAPPHSTSAPSALASRASLRGYNFASSSRPRGLGGAMRLRTQRARQARWPPGHLSGATTLLRRAALAASGAPCAPALNERAKRAGHPGISPGLQLASSSCPRSLGSASLGATRRRRL